MNFYSSIVPGRRYRCLTIPQPHAWAIFHAGKDVEMRSRPTSYVGPVVVYVTHHFDKLYYEFMRDNAGTLGIQRIPDRVPTLSYWYYKIVGKFDILGCVRHHPSKWFTRRGHAYAYIIGNVELFPQPINVSKRFSQRRLPLFSEVIFDFQPVAIQRLHLDNAYK